MNAPVGLDLGRPDVGASPVRDRQATEAKIRLGRSRCPLGAFLQPGNIRSGVRI